MNWVKNSKKCKPNGNELMDMTKIMLNYYKKVFVVKLQAAVYKRRDESPTKSYATIRKKYVEITM